MRSSRDFKGHTGTKKGCCAGRVWSWNLSWKTEELDSHLSSKLKSIVYREAGEPIMKRRLQRETFAGAQATLEQLSFKEYIFQERFRLLALRAAGYQ